MSIAPLASKTKTGKRLRHAWYRLLRTRDRGSLIKGLIQARRKPGTVITESEKPNSDQQDVDFSSTRLAQLCPAYTNGESAFRLLDDGHEAFIARLSLIDLAERTLDLQYYIMRDDETTRALLYALIQAANRGVRVRLLLDDIYAVGRDLEWSLLDAHPNIEMRLFNPFMARGPFGLSRFFELLGNAVRLNRRMHNKLFIADNTAVVVGGRNLGNEYFNAESDTLFVDLDVLGVGPIAEQTTRSFEDFWRSEFAVPLTSLHKQASSEAELRRRAIGYRKLLRDFRGSGYFQDVRDTQFVRELAHQSVALIPGRAYAVWDTPEKAIGKRKLIAGEHKGPRIIELLKQARESITLISPYFIPGALGVERLADYVATGVQVQVLTNALVSTDVPVVHTGYARYREELLKAGVQLFELRPDTLDRKQWKKRRKQLGRSRASLHTKLILIDDQYALIGSANLDPRSIFLNTEFTCVIESSVIVKQLKQLYRELCEPEQSFAVSLSGDKLQWHTRNRNAEVVVFDREPMTGFWKRLGMKLLSWLAPEFLL